MHMTREKKFYTTFFALFWPLVLQNVINFGVNVADNIMLGRYSQIALAAAGAVNMIQFILQSVIGSVGSGLRTLGSQYWGQNRREPVRRLTAITMWTAVILMAVIMGFCLIAPRFVVTLFTKDEEVIGEGLVYLTVVRWSYPVFTLTEILIAALGSVASVKIAFWSSLESLVVNIALNLILIPLMGTRGAALATVLARITTLILVVVIVGRFDKKLELKWNDFFRTDRTLWKDFLRVASPVIAVGAMWGFSNSLSTVILGHLSTEALTANTATSTLYSLIKSGASGAAGAAATIMAMTVGAGDMRKVKEYTKTLQILYLCVGVISAALLFAAQFPVLHMYKFSGELLSLAKRFMIVQCVCTLGMSYQMPCTTGIIRGGGDTKFCMINDIVSIWGIVLPVSALAAFVFHWSPVAVVACLNSDQVFKCLAASIRVNSYKWVKKLTREKVEGEA